MAVKGVQKEQFAAFDHILWRVCVCVCVEEKNVAEGIQRSRIRIFVKNEINSIPFILPHLDITSRAYDHIFFLYQSYMIQSHIMLKNLVI